MTIALPPVLTMGEARATLATLLEAIAADPAPEFDASGLRDLDSAAIAVLLECRRAARAAGKSLRLLNPPPKLGQLAALYGVDGLIDGGEPAPPEAPVRGHSVGA